VGRTAPPSAPLDALMVNAYPKDGELLQVESALVCVRDGMPWLRPHAPIVLAAACPAGSGTHQLFGPGGQLFRPPMRRRSLGDHPVIVFAERVPQEVARTVFWEGYPSASSWNEVLPLLNLSGSSARVGVIPCAPLQVIDREGTHA
jgi:lactate racemase